jgi:hypothetical protein
MPKRVLDFDALWASDKLAACAEWAQSEYAWLYGLADASGSFEITNMRVIWGRVAAIRKNLSLERLQEIFDEFIARGLLFTWEDNGKRYGHWTGSDVPGRLPRRSWRVRLEKFAPPVPCEALAAYSARFGGSKEIIVVGASAASQSVELSDAFPGESSSGFEEHHARFTQEREDAHAQDWDLGLDLDSEKEEKQVCPAPPVSLRVPDGADSRIRNHELDHRSAEETSREHSFAETTPEELLEIYEAERRELPPAGAMTRERRCRCERWLAAGFTPEQFRAAVRCAAATPFLTGEGSRGWQASFDWLIANRSNVRKVLEGEYAPQGRARAGKSRARDERPGPADLYTGAGPRPGDCGVRVNPAALARIRAREAQMAGNCRRTAVRDGVPPHAGELTAGRSTDKAPDVAPGLALDLAPGLAPKPVAFGAQPRAAPVAR